MPRTLIVSMPWCAASRPNLSAGLLKALAERADVPCDVLDASLLLAAEIGAFSYEALAETPALFGLCEHIFAVDMFGADALESEAFLARSGMGEAAPLFNSLRDSMVPSFLESLVTRILAGHYDVVGFTCTFNQVFASLALAKRLKAAAPTLKVLLGGACVHGSMGEEYARAFSFIDHVFLGEADESFPMFLSLSDSGGDLTAIPGITVSGRTTGPAPPMQRMDQVPTPDYSDFFDLRATLLGAGIALPDILALPFEGARGCWWGAKNHCTFCGLNNLGMAFRAKSPADVAAQLRELAGRHGILRFLAADNIITHRDFGELMTALGDLEGEYRLFYEIKANLKRDEVAKLCAAGIRWVQPGIEAFSDGILTRMRKGTTALQNVQLIRLCAEYGIQPSYNLLLGFPDETDGDYDETLDIIGRIGHLPPPSSEPSLVQIHRFSPFHSQPDAHQFINVRPAQYYRHLVPKVRGGVDLNGIAYFFERDVPLEAPYVRHLPRVREAVMAWKDTPRWARLRLGAGFGELEMYRDGPVPRTFALNLLEVCLLILADSPIDLDNLVEMAARRLDLPSQTVHQAVTRLTTLNALLTNRGKIISTVPYEKPKTKAELSTWLQRVAPVDQAPLPAGTSSRREAATTAALIGK